MAITARAAEATAARIRLRGEEVAIEVFMVFLSKGDVGQGRLVRV
jgi:hypothetical protein